MQTSRLRIDGNDFRSVSRDFRSLLLCSRCASCGCKGGNGTASFQSFKSLSPSTHLLGGTSAALSLPSPVVSGRLASLDHMADELITIHYTMSRKGISRVRDKEGSRVSGRNDAPSDAISGAREREREREDAREGGMIQRRERVSLILALISLLLSPPAPSLLASSLSLVRSLSSCVGSQIRVRVRLLSTHLTTSFRWPVMSSGFLAPVSCSFFRPQALAFPSCVCALSSLWILTSLRLSLASPLHKTICR